MNAQKFNNLHWWQYLVIVEELLCSTINPPFDCFPFIPCLFITPYNACSITWNHKVQPLPFDLLPHFWFTRLSSCLSHSLLRFLSALNFLAAALVFNLGISKGCHFSGTAKGKATNLKIPRWVSRKVFPQPPLSPLFGFFLE